MGMSCVSTMTSSAAASAASSNSLDTDWSRDLRYISSDLGRLKRRS
jgi:hypothetical protein